MDTERSLYEEAKLNPEMKIIDLLKLKLNMVDSDVERIAEKEGWSDQLNKPAGTMRRKMARDIEKAIK
jgi:hypothetical protein